VYQSEVLPMEGSCSAIGFSLKVRKRRWRTSKKVLPVGGTVVALAVLAVGRFLALDFEAGRNHLIPHPTQTECA
jgi:hypothetical protein